MEISLNTPALLFPAMSLILLAYTNRFNTLTQLIRNLHAKWQASKDPAVHGQLRNLRLRTRLIRDMQALGVLAMLCCVFCMFLIYLGYGMAAVWTFGSGLVLLMVSLLMSVWEIWISTDALQLELADMQAETLPRRRFLFFGPRHTRLVQEPHAHLHHTGQPAPAGPLEGGPGATFAS